MNKVLLLLLLTVIGSCSNSTPNKIQLDLSDEMVKPKEYLVVKTTDKIKIDGKQDEASWQSSKFSDSFLDIEGVKTPKYDTKLKMLWNEDFLYIYAKMEEPHIWGNLKQRDTVIFYNNDFEVFISPSGTTKNYGEIEINALGTIWDLLLNRPYKENGHPNNFWNISGLQTAIHIEGTLNNPNEIDKYWSVEMAIPMKEIVLLKDKSPGLPVEGEQWRINFSRVQWDFDLVNNVYQRKKDAEGNYFHEYNWVWSPQGKIDMHEPEKWGTIQFTNETNSENVAFNNSEETRINIAAIAIYRMTLNGELDYLQKEEVDFQQPFELKLSDHEILNSTFYKTHFGFEYVITSPDSDVVYSINEYGVLKEKE